MAAEPVTLSAAQQATLLEEAGAAYAQATELAQSDSADAKELFQTAASKYQLIVDSGIRNGKLITDLGNAYLQSGELGYAIVNYERALQFEPSNRQVAVNLQFANARVAVKRQHRQRLRLLRSSRTCTLFRSANATLVQFVGSRCINWTLAISSLLFWGLLIVRTLRANFLCGESRQCRQCYLSFRWGR